jgi:hypothetical protein
MPVCGLLVIENGVDIVWICPKERPKPVAFCHHSQRFAIEISGKFG